MKTTGSVCCSRLRFIYMDRSACWQPDSVYLHSRGQVAHTRLPVFWLELKTGRLMAGLRLIPGFKAKDGGGGETVLEFQSLFCFSSFRVYSASLALFCFWLLVSTCEWTEGPGVHSSMWLLAARLARHSSLLGFICV